MKTITIILFSFLFANTVFAGCSGPHDENGVCKNCQLQTDSNHIECDSYECSTISIFLGPICGWTSACFDLTGGGIDC